jgi:hypothetical protein
MRILAAIPHFYAVRRDPSSHPARYDSERARPEFRSAAVSQCILALHQRFGARQGILNIADWRLQHANNHLASEVHVVICTVDNQHLLNQLPIDRNLYQHHPADIEPRMLGFCCRRVLRDRWGNYDYYCYLEDDLIVHDPWLFAKLAWFNQHVGDDKLLMPNRFEYGSGPGLHKLYVDGDLAAEGTARFQDITDQPQLEGSVLGRQVLFRRPRNPHSGCYFLNARQMGHWMSQPSSFADDTSFVGPLESAATLGVMRAFKIYKPATENASFLEVQHYGTRLLSQFVSTNSASS